MIPVFKYDEQTYKRNINKNNYQLKVFTNNLSSAHLMTSNASEVTPALKDIELNTFDWSRTNLYMNI